MNKYLAKTRKLIIGNVDGESQDDVIARDDSQVARDGSIIANRLTWLLQAGDILVLPYPLSPGFLEYALMLLGLEKESVSILTPSGASRGARLLTYEVLAEEQLSQQLQHAMNDDDAWEIVPYYFYRGIAQLAMRLPVSMKQTLLQYLRQGGAEMLNSKAEFRRYAEAHGIPIAEGMNCYSQLELYQAMSSLIDMTGSVIVKQDRNGGGAGNIVITLGGHEQAVGASETILLHRQDDLDLLSKDLWMRLTGGRKQNTLLVVEAYYSTVAIFYSELEIKESFPRSRLLNFGDMRMEPLWNGFEIPAMSMNRYALGDFISYSTYLAEIARSRGYVGKLNCDGMLTSEGKVLVTEVNGRLGGCTHVHVLAEHLYGQSYGDRYTILTRNNTAVGVSFNALLARLKEEGLLVTGAEQEGVIILVEDIERSGNIEYMVVGKSRERAAALEQTAMAMFERSCLA